MYINIKLKLSLPFPSIFSKPSNENKAEWEITEVLIKISLISWLQNLHVGPHDKFGPWPVYGPCRSSSYVNGTEPGGHPCKIIKHQKINDKTE